KELIRAFELSGRRRVELMAYARVAFHRQYSKGWRKHLALALFIPLYVTIASAACIASGARPSVFLQTIGALVTGTRRGYMRSVTGPVPVAGRDMSARMPEHHV